VLEYSERISSLRFSPSALGCEIICYILIMGLECNIPYARAATCNVPCVRAATCNISCVKATLCEVIKHFIDIGQRRGPFVSLSMHGCFFLNFRDVSDSSRNKL